MKYRAPALEDFVRSPDLFLRKIEFSENTALYTRMSPKSFKDSDFLDERLARVEVFDYSVPLDAMLKAAKGIGRAIELHYIFHTAFCGSTLLAKCLETVESLMVFKEPNILQNLATARGEGIPADSPFYREVRRFVVNSLCKDYAGKKHLIAKATDFTGIVMSDLLNEENKSKAILLHDSLDGTLVSCLYSKDRRQFVKSRVAMMHRFLGEPLKVHGIQPSRLSDAQAAALIWVLYVRNFLDQSRTFGPSRLTAVTAASFYKNPKGVLKMISDFLSLDLPPRTFDGLIESKVWNNHSKLERNYSVKEMEKDKQQRREKVVEEVSEGVKFGRRLMHRLEIPDSFASGLAL